MQPSPTIANANMTLFGRQFRRGEQVPTTVLDMLEGNRRDALYRQRMLRDVSAEEAAEIQARLASRGIVPTGEEGLCPDCGAGPFTRLAQHRAQMHKTSGPALEAEPEEPNEGTPDSGEIPPEAVVPIPDTPEE